MIEYDAEPDRFGCVRMFVSDRRESEAGRWLCEVDVGDSRFYGRSDSLAEAKKIACASALMWLAESKDAVADILGAA